MNPIPKHFRRDQFDFNQRLDLHPVYVYQKTKVGWLGFEVIIARERVGRTFKGRVIEAGWAYPSSEQWGVYGWSFQNIEQARQKAFELVDQLALKAAAEKK